MNTVPDGAPNFASVRTGPQSSLEVDPISAPPCISLGERVSAPCVIVAIDDDCGWNLGKESCPSSDGLMVLVSRVVLKVRPD